MALHRSRRTGRRRIDYTLRRVPSLAGDPQFVGMIGVTLMFVVASVALQMALGLLLAWLFDAAERRRVWAR